MTDTADSLLMNLRLVCERIANGDYAEINDLFAIAGSEDAPPVIQQLAESFGSMAVQIEAREFRLSSMLEELKETNRQLEDAQRRLSSENVTLRDQVQRLRIEIDQGRKDQEVTQIVETDYFQSLQSRAREMRTRHRS